ncbi:hypothetical protein HK096_004147 [Nowakowskiella sp. JEL0078]|nr:hypothetical protein HK096_004147 [Nowakowskiella sp. JEL0078]
MSSIEFRETINEEYNRVLDHDLKALDDALSHILNASTFRATPVEQKNSSQNIFMAQNEYKDKYKLAQEQQLVDGAAANIVRSTESLLNMTRQLKQSVLLNDFSELNTLLRSRKKKVEETKQRNIEKLEELKKDLEEVVHELEFASAGRMNDYEFVEKLV